MADFIRRDTAQLLQGVPDATRETIIGALEIALEHRDWEEDRDDVYELHCERTCRTPRYAATSWRRPSPAGRAPRRRDQEPAWVGPAVKLFVAGAATTRCT